ncbi:hypothetical protein [Parasphingopyxis lamellibrachiae]|uniref:Uncharacterized protein n=1 Tax=Parasphingopyxis lamellibrachiae TaxID=680125 RepID=A0A3D9FHA1_9SPHN|nr:hypothetical protein [Parasphingopyxis lamellibrachiae]RED16942.1 hypothetical protein DFR46_1976 [Parasphingopyxis lamellibrachiae]
MSIFREIARGALGGHVRNRTAGRGLLGAGIGLIAARVATRSLPGAALVGGGLVAKYLWDRKRERDEADAPGAGSAETETASAGGDTAG